MGLQWNIVLNPTGLYECLIVHRKNVEFFQRGLTGWDVSYESSANEPYGKIPMVYNPTNQTTKIGKIPKDQNPPKFL